MTLRARPLQMNTAQAGFEAAFKVRLHWSADTNAEIEQRVSDILHDVQLRGDAALLAYTHRFDGLAADSMKALELTQAELKIAFDGLPTAQREALQASSCGILFHRTRKGVDDGANFFLLELERRLIHHQT